jgi:general secretion pathway protein K
MKFFARFFKPERISRRNFRPKMSRRGKIAGHPVALPEPGIAPGKDGFILVAVLWILAALAALAGVYSVYIGNTAAAVRLYDDRLQAHALIAAGLEITAYRLIGFDDAHRPTYEPFAFAPETSQFHVDGEYRSEGARIDLNLAPKEMFYGLFAVLGATPEDAQSYADRIIAWRTKPKPGAPNDEADAYQSAGLSYGPRQAPFQSVAELRLVRGLPPELVDAALPFVTVFNGRAEIDVNVAARQVIAALPRISPDAVANILNAQDPRNPEAVLRLVGPARASVAVGGRKATRVCVHVSLDSGRKVNAEVVLLITDNDPEPYHVLSWRDDFDNPNLRVNCG